MKNILYFSIITFGVFVLSITLALFVIAWTEPSQPPPLGNVPAPINIGSGSQSKAGPLTVESALRSNLEIYSPIFYSLSNPSWYVNPAGQSVFSGNVGIGTTGPNEKLEVAGNIILKTAGVPTLKVGSTPGGGVTARGQVDIGGEYNTGFNLGGPKLYIGDYDNDAAMTVVRMVDENAYEDFFIKAGVPAGSSPTMYFRGNVGIGTTGPKGTLHTKGTLYITGTDAYTPANVPALHTDGSDTALFVPTTTGGNLDLRLYIDDDASDRFSIWGNSCRIGCQNLANSWEVLRVEAGGNIYAPYNAHDSCAWTAWTCADQQACSTGYFVAGVERGANSGAALCGAAPRQWYQMRIYCCQI